MTNSPANLPSATPNVVIENPHARKVARTILDVIGATLAVVIAIDAAADTFTLLSWTVPALAGWSAARAVFGLGVDNPNTPKA